MAISFKYDTFVPVRKGPESSISGKVYITDYSATGEDGTPLDKLFQDGKITGVYFEQDTTGTYFLRYDVATKKIFVSELASVAAEDHANLDNLDYVSSGHTGFEPAKGADDNYVTDDELAAMAPIITLGTPVAFTSVQDVATYAKFNSVGHGFTDGDYVVNEYTPDGTYDGNYYIYTTHADSYYLVTAWPLDPGNIVLFESGKTGAGTTTLGTTYTPDTSNKYITEDQLADELATKQDSLTFGIANTNAVQINAADVADNDYAKFTATGLEGRSYTEVKSDLAITAADVGIPSGIGTPAYDDVQDFINTTRSAGRLTGGVVTKGTGATVSITAMDGMIFTGNTLGTSPLIYFKKAAQTSITPTGLTDVAVNWIYIDYDGGNLTYKATTTRSTIDEYTMFTIARVWVSGSDLEVQQSGHSLYNKDRRSHNRLILKYGGMDRVSGGNISAHATALRIQTDAGSWYIANTPFTTIAKDTFKVWYKNGSATWVESASLTLFSDAFDGGTKAVYNYYQNGNTLTTLGANKYGVFWVFLCPGGDIYIILGAATYSNAGAAQAATVPSILPPYSVNFSRLIGRVICQNSGAAFYSVESAFAQTFAVSTNIAHNDTAGVVGGGVDDRYHVTGAQNTIIASMPTTTVDNTIPRFDGIAGKIQTSGVVIDDNNNIAATSFNGVVPTETAGGFTLEGGTASKTLTVDETATLSNKMAGAASSTTNGIVTFTDTGGKAARSVAGVTQDASGNLVIAAGKKIIFSAT